MPENAELIKAYANGEIIECWCNGWSEWLPLTDMRDSALRAFMGISEDSDWKFRIKE